MSKRKIMLLAMSVCLIAILAVGGTLAYFTAGDEATNTFTVGNVKIDLVEEKWDELGKVDAPEVYPTEALAKDPVVVNKGANPCFVRLQVTGWDCLINAGLSKNNIIYRTDYTNNKLGDNWVLHSDGYFYYTKVLQAGEKTDALFDQIVIPADLTNGDGETPYDIVVKAEAVQAQGAQAKWADVTNPEIMTVSAIANWFTTCLTTSPIVAE